MVKTPITLRQIIRESLEHLITSMPVINKVKDSSLYDCETDLCVQKIKQKLAHLRRVMYQELEHKKLMQPYDQVIGSEVMQIQVPISTDEILDIVYMEIDHAIEGLDYDKKNLKELSREQ